MDSATFARSLEKGIDALGASGELNPGISPVHVVTEESEHPEYRYLRLERFAEGVAEQAASVGNFSYVILTNPTGSGALIMVQTIMIANTTAAALQCHVRSGLVGALSGVSNLAGRLRDLRYGPSTARATGQVGVATPAAHFTGGFGTRVMLQAGSTFPWYGPMILPPGTWCAVSGNVANQVTTASFQWIERAAESAELQGSGV